MKSQQELEEPEMLRGQQPSVEEYLAEEKTTETTPPVCVIDERNLPFFHNHSMGPCFVK